MNYKVLGVFVLVIAVVIGVYAVNRPTPEPPVNPGSEITTGTNQPDTGKTDTNNPDTKKPEAIQPEVNNPDTSKPEKPVTDSFVEVRDITAAMSGMTRETRGVVTVLNEAKGNVYFTLKDVSGNNTIKGVLFKKTNNDDPSRKEMLLQSRDSGSPIYLKGEIDVYKGELEIKTWQVYNK